MKKQLKSALIYGVSNALSSLTLVFLVPFYTRAFSVSNFGVYDFYTSINLLVFTVFESQMISGFMRYYYQAKQSNDISKLFSTVITFYLLNITIAVASIFLILYFFSSKFPMLELRYFLPILIGLFPAQIYELYLVFLRLEYKGKAYLAYNVSQAVLTLTLGLGLVFIFKLGVLGALWGLILSKLLLAIPILLYICKHNHFKLGMKNIGRLLVYSAPQLPTVVFSWLQSSLARFFILYFLSGYVLGIYALIMKVGLVVALLLRTFRLVWDPYCMKLFSLDNKPYAKKMIAASLDFYVYIGYFFIFIFACLMPVIFIVFAPKEYWQYFYYSELVVVSLFVQGATNITSMGNDWVKKTYYNTISFFVGVTINYILLYKYITKYKFIAIFTSFFIGVLIINLTSLFSSQLNEKIDYRKSTLTLLYAFPVFLMSLLSYLIVSNQMNIDLYEYINIFFLTVIILYFIRLTFNNRHKIKMVGLRFRF